MQDALCNQGKKRKAQQDGSRQQDNKKQNHKQIHSSILSRCSHLVPCFKAWRQRFCAGGQPKEAGLRVQDWDMWLKFLCVSRCWICCASLQLVAWLCRCYFSRLRRGLGSHLGLRGQGTRTQRFDGAVPLRHLRCLETAKNEGDYPLSEGMIKRVACIGFCRSFSASKRLC